jgi:hypothetical protein
VERTDLLLEQAYRFLKFIDLPRRTQREFELALAWQDEKDEEVIPQLTSFGWNVVDAISLSLDIMPYRDYILGSRREFTMSWARLLKRVFDIDIEHCPNCGGALKIIAAIEDPPVIVRILTHLGLPTSQFALASIPIYVVSTLPIYLRSTFA